MPLPPSIAKHKGVALVGGGVLLYLGYKYYENNIASTSAATGTTAAPASIAENVYNVVPSTTPATKPPVQKPDLQDYVQVSEDQAVNYKKQGAVVYALDQSTGMLSVWGGPGSGPAAKGSPAAPKRLFVTAHWWGQHALPEIDEETQAEQRSDSYDNTPAAAKKGKAVPKKPVKKATAKKVTKPAAKKKAA